MIADSDKSLEQLYTLEVAAELIPMPSIGALYQFLHKHKEEFPPLYRMTHIPGGGTVDVRFLSHEECIRIRALTFKMTTHARKSGPGAGRPRKIGNRYELDSTPIKHTSKPYSGPLAGIIRRATSNV